LVTPLDQVKQRPFDIQNEQRIDSLYAVYKTYIGKTLVGKDYESVMWSVIQHSDIHTMERYLPQISKAVEQKELSTEPLKMLIDRIYTVKYQYQIFGSQLGVPVADEKTKSEVIKNYKLE
jgi:selenocysteine-specific translation elongation factor